jgi:PAS domain S-box-containing protein
VPIRADIERMADHALTQQERNAFDEIADLLRERVVGGRSDEATPPDLSEVAEQDAVPETAEPVAQADADWPDDDVASAEPDEPEPEPAPKTPPRSEPPREIVVARPPLSQRPASALSAQVAETQRRMREMTAILDTATDGVIILDAMGRIESVNGSAEALFGLEAHEMEGRPFGELLTPDSRKSALDYLSGLKDSGVASLLNEGREVEALAGAGSIPLFMTMGRISSEEGGRFCAVLRDITHWKRIEGELLAAKLAAEHASSQKSDFLARVSHELRTPLNAVIGFAEVMIDERFGPVGNERYREYLRDIRTSGEHVVSLVNDLLDISKIEAGKLDLHFAAVSLNEVVRESIGLMQPQANRARVVLRSSLSREVPAIVADERTLRQIVLNLLSNSVKFTGPGGQVIASTSLAESGEAILRIRDTGEGMSEEELTRALEPFRQISTSTMADRSGTGLGLPLTKALVEANRATLSIKSARGEGTVVTVTVPATRVLSE